MKAINITSDDFKEGFRMGKEQTKESIKEMIEIMRMNFDLKLNEYFDSELSRNGGELFLDDIEDYLLSKIGDNSEVKE